MFKKSIITLLFLSSFCVGQDWNSCQTVEPKLTGFKPLTSATEQIFTYRVDIKKHPKVSGKTLTSAQVYDVIDKGLATAYGDKLAIEFKRVTGPAKFVYRFENHRDRYRGTHFSDQYIMLHSEAPWSLNGIAQIAVHEIGHSYWFFGYGHNNGSFVENGVRYSHLMNPDDPRKAKKYKTYPTYTSPQETGRLVARYGKQVEIPPPVDPTQEKLKALRKERDAKKELRIEHKAAIDQAIKIYRANEDDIKKLNEQIQALLK